MPTPCLPTIDRDTNVTRITRDQVVVEAQRVWYGRWRVASGPVVDGQPDRSVDWTEHGFHDNRAAAETAALTVAQPKQVAA